MTYMPLRVIVLASIATALVSCVTKIEPVGRSSRAKPTTPFRRVLSGVGAKLFPRGSNIDSPPIREGFTRGGAADNGDTAVTEGRYSDAIKCYSDAIAKEPEFAAYYENRGHAYFGMGKYTDAIADYSEAIRLDDKYANAYYNRGLVFMKRGDYERALADFNATLRMQPDDSDAKVQRGTATDANNRAR
ncbi:MAG: tetratricopeptide repeat protein [Planctomycetaceae bacterium]